MKKEEIKVFPKTCTCDKKAGYICEKCKERYSKSASILGKLSAAKLGFEGLSERGKKGGRSRAAALTPERRKEIALMGAKARAKKFAERKIAENNE